MPIAVFLAQPWLKAISLTLWHLSHKNCRARGSGSALLMAMKSSGMQAMSVLHILEACTAGKAHASISSHFSLHHVSSSTTKLAYEDEETSVLPPRFGAAFYTAFIYVQLVLPV
eukprot:1148650-Pelagomonas_calceolata.AAC.7